MKLESDLYKLIPNALPMNLRIPIWQSLLTKDYNFGWNDYNGVEVHFQKQHILSARKTNLEIGMVKII